MAKIEKKKTCFTTSTCTVGKFNIEVTDDPESSYEIKISEVHQRYQYNDYTIRMSRVEAGKLIATLEQMLGDKE